jgi:vitamin B12 transporter
MIVYDGSAAPGAPTYRNGAAADAQGVEAGVTSMIGPGIHAAASYTYLLARAADDAGVPSAAFEEGKPLIRRPKHSVELSLRARMFGRATLGGSMTYVGRRDDVDFNQFPSQRVELRGYAVVDLAGEADLLRAAGMRPGVSATIRVENLFNAHYDQVLGFPGRNRGVFGGARFQF